MRVSTRGQAPRQGITSTAFDPFTVNPIRRSLAAIAVSAGVLVAPARLLDAESTVLVMVAVGWLAAAVLTLSVPVLFLATVEEAWGRVRRRVQPPIEELGLSPRVVRLLRRHRLDTITALERVDDATLMLLPNFDARARHEVRRAISLRRYAAEQRAWDKQREREAARRRRAAGAAAPISVRLARLLDVRPGRR